MQLETGLTTIPVVDFGMRKGYGLSGGVVVDEGGSGLGMCVPDIPMQRMYAHTHKHTHIYVLCLSENAPALCIMSPSVCMQDKHVVCADVHCNTEEEYVEGEMGGVVKVRWRCGDGEMEVW